MISLPRVPLLTVARPRARQRALRRSHQRYLAYASRGPYRVWDLAPSGLGGLLPAATESRDIHTPGSWKQALPPRPACKPAPAKRTHITVAIEGKDGEGAVFGAFAVALHRATVADRRGVWRLGSKQGPCSNFRPASGKVDFSFLTTGKNHTPTTPKTGAIYTVRVSSVPTHQILVRGPFYGKYGKRSRTWLRYRLGR